MKRKRARINPITHYLIGWSIANTAETDKRSRALVTLAGVVPDVDGAGIIAEKLTIGTAHPLYWWTEYHHTVGHNIFFGTFLSILCYSLAKSRRLTAAGLAFVAFHLHLLCDVLGSGGPDGDHWDVPYLWPVNKNRWISWSGQWELTAWPNVLITAVFIAIALRLAWKRGYSPIEMVSQSADAAVVTALRARFRM